MDLGRAVETQRDALLRLLAGWGVVVELLSCGPFAGRMPRWFYAFVSSVLDRAEAATGYLVIASARVLVAQGVFVPEDGWLAVARCKRSPRLDRESVAANAGLSPDDEVSCDGLRVRMKALKALLEDLPRHALRLLRRCVALCEARCSDYRVMANREPSDVRLEFQTLVPRVERPPDKLV